MRYNPHEQAQIASQTAFLKILPNVKLDKLEVVFPQIEMQFKASVIDIRQINIALMRAIELTSEIMKGDTYSYDEIWCKRWCLESTMGKDIR